MFADLIPMLSLDLHLLMGQCPFVCRFIPSLTRRSHEFSGLGLHHFAFVDEAQDETADTLCYISILR
jgi:hypothetical protein